MVARFGALASALMAWARAAHPILLAAPAVLGLAAVLDALGGADTRRAVPTLLAAAAGLGAGGVVGIVCSVWFGALRRAPVLVRWLLWSALGGVVFAWLCEGLGVWANLAGSYSKLARLCLIGAAVSGVSVITLGMGLQPSRAVAGDTNGSSAHDTGPWGRLPGWLRIAVALLGGCAAAGFAWIDRRGFVVEYPAASASLRWGGLILVSLGGIELVRTLRQRPLFTHALLGLMAFGALFSFAATGPAQAAPLLGRPYPALALQLLRAASDWDGDGHSAWFGGQDCAAFSQRVSPSASEIVANGVDDNCRGGDLAKADEPTASGAAATPNASATSVVYITVDTVGVQHLGTYGYARDTSPNLDRWAEERAVTFEQAYTSGSSTTLVLGSNFRGVYPRRLNWSRVVKTQSGKFLPLADAGQIKAERVQRIYRLPTLDPRPALPHWLRQGGVKSLAVSAVHFVQADSNLVGVFDEQIALTDEGSKEPNDAGATHQALTWLEQLSPTDRFFLWVHYLGPHSPSTRTPGVKDFGRGLLNEYDHEIRVFDERVAPLLKALSARQDAGESLAVIVSADHGEEFAQHRFHGHSVEEGTAHIPLLVSLPGVRAHRSAALVSSVDVFPTVLSLTASPSPGGLDGRDLSALIKGQANDAARVVLMDGWVNDTNDGLPFNRVAALGATRRMSWDLLDFAETARNLPTITSADADWDAEDRRLRAALTDYLERVPVDPRTEH